MKTSLGAVLAPAALVFGWSLLSAAESAAPVAPPTADVHGTWEATVEYGQGVGHPIFHLVQDGDRLSGDYKGQLGEARVTGRVHGQQVTFSFTVPVGESMKVDYTGTVDGSTMKGRVVFGSYGDGTFTARKRVSLRSHAER